MSGKLLDLGSEIDPMPLLMLRIEVVMSLSLLDSKRCIGSVSPENREENRDRFDDTVL